jgi:hypothetical protein
VEGGTARHGVSRLELVERTAYQNADGVVAVSEAMKQDVTICTAWPTIVSA